MSPITLQGWKHIVFADGNLAIAKHPKTAFLCSRGYPAGAVLRVYDWAKEARAAGECVISGFHSALERDVLEILLAGSQPIILACARGLPKRYSPEIKRAIDERRLLVVSPFPATVSRITAANAAKRNAFMLTIAARVVVGYATEHGALAEILHSAACDKEVIRLVD